MARRDLKIVDDPRDQTHLQALHDGCSIAELAKVFKKNDGDVAQALRNVPPSGERRGKPIWHMREAAPFLIKPVAMEDIEAYIKKMRPNDLPPFLLKEFWAGKISRQKFELEEGNLWPTEDVMLVFNAVFKNLRAGIMLFSDMVEAQTDLTPKQRQIINRLADALLIELKKTLIDGDFDDDVKPKAKTETVLDA